MGTRCLGCGRPLNEISELHDVHSIGLALFGICNKCKTLGPCEKLWQKNCQTIIENTAGFQRIGMEQIGVK